MFRSKKLDLGGFVNIKVIRDHTKRKVFEQNETERSVDHQPYPHSGPERTVILIERIVDKHFATSSATHCCLNAPAPRPNCNCRKCTATPVPPKSRTDVLLVAREEVFSVISAWQEYG